MEDPALRDSALTLLKTVIPDSLAISSLLSDADNDQGFNSKISRLDSVLSRASQETDPIKGVAKCLRALPKNIDTWNSPLCYGPSLGYKPEIHPDANLNPKSQNQSMGNQLPGGDLGIWTETQNKRQACAAAKLNQLGHNAAVYSDLATGSMAMMVCVAAFAGDTLPGPGQTLDVSGLLAKIQKQTSFKQQAIQLNTATVKNSEGGYEIHLEGKFKERPFKVSTLHNSTDKKGAITVLSGPPENSKLEGKNPRVSSWRVTSLKYKCSEGKSKFRMISSAQKDSASAISAIHKNGEVSTQKKDFMGDLNIAQGIISSKGGHMAFGWQAGAGDGYLRVFNATTNDEKGEAWFGYSQNDDSEDIQNLLKIDGMICNWAGPGNQHQPKLFVQKQEMERINKRYWKATKSNITYAPINSCDVDNSLEVFPTMPVEQINHNLIPLSDYTSTFTEVEIN